MKNLFYAVLALISLTACGQTNAPQNVLNAFNQKFPNAKEVEWGKESENIWEAEFESSDKDMSANFNLKGEWLETETELAKKELPARVKATIKTTYKGYKVEEVGYTETPQLKAYEIEVKKGEKLIEVMLDDSGNIIKTKTVKEKDGEKD